MAEEGRLADAEPSAKFALREERITFYMGHK
jgi:hypothetical protein